MKRFLPWAAAVLLAIGATSPLARADAITDLVAKGQRETAAVKPDGLKPSDRAECRAQVLASNATGMAAIDLETACLNAKRLKAQGR